MMRAAVAFLSLFSLLIPIPIPILTGCRSSSSAAPAPRGTDARVAARPYEVDLPAGYDPAKPAPLLLLLHGYGDRGASLASTRWNVAAAATPRGMLLARPNGTADSHGSRFWNATDACCDFESKAIDDVGYLTAVIDDVAAHYRVDPKRVWALGLSNGGFMAHRLACDAADRFAAVVSVSGAT